MQQPGQPRPLTWLVQPGWSFETTYDLELLHVAKLGSHRSTMPITNLHVPSQAFPRNNRGQDHLQKSQVTCVLCKGRRAAPQENPNIQKAVPHVQMGPMGPGDSHILAYKSPSIFSNADSASPVYLVALITYLHYILACLLGLLPSLHQLGPTKEPSRRNPLRLCYIHPPIRLGYSLRRLGTLGANFDRSPISVTDGQDRYDNLSAITNGKPLELHFQQGGP
ncbi:hypothetical protein F5Y11DRAFT_187487 [Daldinia sp. FL1419]|nr:hypothetical protein F5Y11DRAFT_187487 [Daldinia sp. FL1419]